MKSRAAAVVAAIVLIAVAVFVRGLLVDDDAASGGSDGPKGNGGRAPVVACTPDLIAVCDALAAEGLIAPRTPDLDLDEAATPPEEVEGWITWNPAPAIANFDAEPPAWGPVEPLGSAPLAALAKTEVFGGMGSDCNQQVDWACFATDGLDWGLTFGVGEPTAAEGLSRISVLAVGLSPGLDTAELTSSDLRGIVDSATNGQDVAAAMSLAATRPGDQYFVIGPEGLLQRRADSQQGKAQLLDVQVLDPETEAVVVLAPRTGADLGDLAEACEDDEVADALREVGVDPCEGDPTDDLAGFLYTVREKAS